MLDANTANQFKVSNSPALTGWNATMSVLAILNQLQDTYGKPDMMTIFTNESLFRSPMGPSDSPEVLFYRIEQCQEIQTLAKDPYTQTQIINNAVRLLQQSARIVGIWPYFLDQVAPRTAEVRGVSTSPVIWRGLTIRG